MWNKANNGEDDGANHAYRKQGFGYTTKRFNVFFNFFRALFFHSRTLFLERLNQVGVLGDVGVKSVEESLVASRLGCLHETFEFLVQSAPGTFSQSLHHR